MDNDIYVGTNGIIIISKKMFHESIYFEENQIRNTMIQNFRKDNFVLIDYLEMKQLNIRDFVESLLQMEIINNLLEYLYNLIKVFEDILTKEESIYLFTLLEQEEMQF